MTQSNIGKKIYLLLATGIFVLVLLGVFSNFFSQQNSIEENSIEKIVNYKQRFNNYVLVEAKTIKSFLEFVQEKQELQEYFLTSNKSLLFEKTQKIFENLNLNNDITHFYFIKPDGKVLLRVHDFARDGDRIERFTFLEAKKSGKIFHGIEFGIKKNYTLRVVAPWFVDGKLIGYIEIGKEIDKIINTLSKQFDTEIFFAVNKNEYKNAPEFIQKNLEDTLQTNNHYIVYNTMPVQHKIADFFNKNQHLSWNKIDKNNYISYLETLEDVSHKKLGKILYLVNITKQYAHLKSSLLFYIILISISSFMILIIGYFFTKKQQRNLNKLLFNLEDEKQKLQISNIENKNLLSLFDKSDSVLFRWNNDHEWSIDYVSSNVQTLLGFSKEEFLTQQITYAACIHPDDIEHVFWEVEQGKASKNDFFKHEPYRIITRDGNIKWVLDYTVLAKDKNGVVTHFLGYIIDITDRELSKNKLAEQKQELETIFNYVQDGIAITDIEGNFLNCNNEFIKMLGFTKEEIYTKNCTELTAPENKHINQKALQKAIQMGSVENIDKDCLLKNGKRISVNMSMSLLPDKRRLLLLIHDTTSLKIMQEQTKLASMGEMIGNIAHQWRQPLSIITSSASGMKMQVEFGQKIENNTIVNFSDLIVQQAQYLSETIDNFRNFIKQDTEYSNISVKSALEQTLRLMNATLKDNYITLVSSLEVDCIMNGNTNELCEAFINIINNSKDVLKENITDYSDRLLFLSVKKIDKTYEITIKDSGGGIASKDIDRIFEPYFTTKHQSVGTGLGLAMVDKIIRERHLGTIDVYNDEYTYNDKLYKGACFKIAFQCH